MFIKSECTALYSPSNFYSTAMYLPKGGDIILIKTPDKKYQAMIMAGPSQPTNSDNFLEKRVRSRIGLVKFKYRLARLVAHFSRS